ncbi:hypothetical protein [Streptomyces sp. NPDC051684]|uniref:hypothetical protein n=1 Tax=Streptomyces sp. NPDC051684 TaxID=3365670 RepID=UPI0037BCEFEB
MLLALDFCGRLVRDRARWEHEADSPPALTAVAATTVLGTRYALAGLEGLAAALLVVAVTVWRSCCTPSYVTGSGGCRAWSS